MLVAVNLLLICTLLYLTNGRQISVNFHTYPPTPTFNELVTFKASVLTTMDSDLSPPSLIERLQNASFLWYSKSDDNIDEFSLVGIGRSMVLRADSFFTAIYNLTMLLDNGETVIDYSRKVSMRPTFGVEISINNRSFQNDFRHHQRLRGDFFDFRCRVSGGATHVSAILPSMSSCKNRNVESMSRSEVTDFVFSLCKIVAGERYGCKVSNQSKEYSKTFIIIENPLMEGSSQNMSPFPLLMVTTFLLSTLLV